MSWQISSDWLNAGEWTAFPFVEGNVVSSYVVDAQVILPASVLGRRILLTDLVPSSLGTRALRLVDDLANELIALSDVPVVRAFGVYELWEVTGSSLLGAVSVFLVVKPTADAQILSGAEAELTPEVLSGSLSGVLVSASANSVEIAGPGEALNIHPGSNILLEAQRDELGGLRVVISAEYLPDGPCAPTTVDPAAPTLSSINGLRPNKRGELQLRGGKCLSVRIGGPTGQTLVDVYDPCEEEWVEDVEVGPTYHIELLNICSACCDCRDYIRLLELVKITHGRLQTLNNWSNRNQELYSEILLYVRSVLDLEIVGSRYDDLLP